MLDVDAARRTPIERVIGSKVFLQKSGNQLRACCPFHDDRTPSFYVYPDTNRYYCFGCHAHGDVIDFLMMFEGISFPEAVSELTGDFSPITAPPPVSKGTKANARENRKYAQALWNGAGPIIGTIGETYLINRGIALQDFRCEVRLRFDYLSHPETKQRHPTILTRLDDADGNLAAIQRTFLTDDGYKLPRVNAKLSLGSIRGNATKLSPSRSEIVICEGLEDGLSLQAALPNVAVWVTAGTANLAGLSLPRECKRVTIAADNDEAGTRAAIRAADGYSAAGFDARTMHPDHQFKDFNEQHQKAVNA